jgi:hypothetical protein
MILQGAENSDSEVKPGELGAPRTRELVQSVQEEPIYRDADVESQSEAGSVGGRVVHGGEEVAWSEDKIYGY